MLRIQETAFAKINLDLRVCHRREDGYHDLDSLVVFADFGDKLTFEPADGFALTIDGPFGDMLSSSDGNLVARAATALAAAVGRETNVHIRLKKTVPIAAGLGGGSADAAATLRGLKRLWNLPHSLSDLLPLALSLGADVPVCLGSKAARMQGIGEQLASISQPADLLLLLVNPGKTLSTADVFRGLRIFSGVREPRAFDATKDGFRLHLQGSVNDLEQPAIQIEPAIRCVLDALRRQPGCLLARMSGSGATCFGLFDEAGTRDHVASKLAASYPDWWVMGAEAR